MASVALYAPRGDDMGIAWWLVPALVLTSAFVFLSILDVFVVVKNKIVFNDRLESARLALTVLFFTSLWIALLWIIDVGDANTIRHCHMVCAGTFTFLGVARILAIMKKHNPLFWIDIACCGLVASISAICLLP